MQSFLALSTIIALLTTLAPVDSRRSFAHIQTESWNGSVQDEIEIGPLSIEFRIRTTGIEEPDDASTAISRIGVNTDISTALDPLSIRVVLVLHLDSSRTTPATESAIHHVPAMQKALPMGGLFAFDKEMNCG